MYHISEGSVSITGIKKLKNIFVDIRTLKACDTYVVQFMIHVCNSRCGKAAGSFQSSILLIHCYQHQIPCNKMTTTHTYTGVYCTLYLIG